MVTVSYHLTNLTKKYRLTLDVDEEAQTICLKDADSGVVSDEVRYDAELGGYLAWDLATGRWIMEVPRGA